MKFLLLTFYEDEKAVLINLNQMRSMEPVSDEDRQKTRIHFADGDRIVVMETFNDICAAIEENIA